MSEASWRHLRHFDLPRIRIRCSLYCSCTTSPKQIEQVELGTDSFRNIDINTDRQKVKKQDYGIGLP